MIKVAVICSSTARIGHVRQGATQINAFEATKRYKKYEAYLFSAAYTGAKDFEIIGKVKLIRILSSPVKKMCFGLLHLKNPDLYYVYRVAKEIKRLGIKIAHVRNRPAYIPYLRKLLGKNIKLIIHEHNQNIADTMTEKQAMEVLGSLDAYVGVSKFTTDYEITNKYPQFKNISYSILNGVNIEKFIPAWKAREKAEQLRKIHGLSGSKVVLFVGAIRERKGIHFLVQAMKQVIKKHPKAKLLIAGGSAKNISPSDTFGKKVVKEINQMGSNAKFLGFVPSSKINEIYLLADIFAGLSVWEEPFGLVFAEASASGLPVVASKKGGIPEIIQDNISGFLVDDPSNINQISEKISYLIENPEKAAKMGKTGREIMLEKFSWQRAADEIEQLYDKLILEDK